VLKAKIRLGGVEYVVSPIPPSLAPLQSYIDKVMNYTPSSYEEAAKLSGELEKATAKLLAATVTPQPSPDQASQIFKAVQELTVKTLKDAQFFRESPKLDSQQSGVDGVTVA